MGYIVSRTELYIIRAATAIAGMVAVSGSVLLVGYLFANGSFWAQGLPPGERAVVVFRSALIDSWGYGALSYLLLSVGYYLLILSWQRTSRFSEKTIYHVFSAVALAGGTVVAVGAYSLALG